MHKYFALILILATTSIFGMKMTSSKIEIPFSWLLANNIEYSNLEKSGPEYPFVNNKSGLYMTCSDVVKLYKADMAKRPKSTRQLVSKKINSPKKNKKGIITTYRWLKQHAACGFCNKKQSTKKS